jgi:tRNA(Ile)-lysidine synthase
MQDRLSARVQALLQDSGYAADRALVVGVSGGADSLTLLHILQQTVNNDLLHVAHLDHGLRAEAATEARDLSEMVERWGLPFHERRVNVAVLAQNRGWTVEEAGRNARYQFLADVARLASTDQIAVGHNADDQAETILLHLLRGSGVGGLRGMSLAGPLPGVPEMTLLRPLLNTSRTEIEAYCARQELQPALDHSNFDTSYTRNHLRHELMPVLAGQNPQIVRHLRQMGLIAGAEDDLLSALTDELWPQVLRQVGPGWLLLDRPLFQQQPLALRRRTLRKAFAGLTSSTMDISFEAVEGALAVADAPKAGARASLPGGISLLADYETLILSSAPEDVATELPQLAALTPQTLEVPGHVLLGNGWVLTADFVEATIESVTLNRDPWQAYLQLDAPEALVVRSRRAGERMQPLGMNGRSAGLQDIFVNRKVPGRLRARWPLVSLPDHVVWVVGHLIDHRVHVTGTQDKIVRLRCHPPEGA